MHQNDLPFEMLEPSELEEAKAEIIQVLNSLGQKEVAADVMRGPTNEMFYKVTYELLRPITHARLPKFQNFICQTFWGSQSLYTSW